MHKRAKDAIVGTVTGATAIGALATGLIVNAGADTARIATNASASQADAGTKSSSTSSSTQGHTASTGQVPEAAEAAANAGKAVDETAGKPSKQAAEKAASLPKGSATGTSFWDPETASGRPMRYKTLASPYWPLGTKVKITYQGKSVIGVVEDFGPAEWAVAQHSPPAIIDLSEEMMADFTGVRENSIPITFEVLTWGDGRTYVTSGTGYKLAMGK